MKKLRAMGFAGVNILTKPPHIMAWSIAETAGGARKNVIENWPGDEDEQGRWKKARRAGVRVRKVEIRTV